MADQNLQIATVLAQALLDGARQVTIEKIPPKETDPKATLPWINVSRLNSIEIDCTNLKAIYLEEQ